MINLAMTHDARKTYLEFERVLSHCFEMSGTNVYQHALDYGRKSGYLNKRNEVTRSGTLMLELQPYEIAA